MSMVDEHAVSDGCVHLGRTVRTYATDRFRCEVFSKDASGQMYPDVVPWVPITDLGPYSLFLGLNYPINIAVSDAEVSPLQLTRSNCVYTSHQAVGLVYMPRPEICRFTLYGQDAAFGFSNNVVWHGPETPLWFIPSFANAQDWNLRAEAQT